MNNKAIGRYVYSRNRRNLYSESFESGKKDCCEVILFLMKEKA